MCGRFAQSQPVTHYAHALDPAWMPIPLDLKPTWNMAPGRKVLVFHDDDAGHVADLLYWGFLPSWAKPEDRKPINARVETAAAKPYFRHAWKSGRCLIPADGWYEWKETPKGKQPNFIHRADDQPIFMAGLYEVNPQANLTSFAILTMEAHGGLRDIHEREPLVLSAEDGLHWIKRNLAPDKIAAITQHPLTANSFAWYDVSNKVNKPQNDGVELLRRITAE